MTAIHDAGAGSCASDIGCRGLVSIALGVGSAMVAALPAHGGQVEELMSFQARLTDNLGNPLQDGTHTLDFFIYDAATGGAIVGVVLDVVVQTGGGTGIVSTSIGPMDKGWFDEAPRFLALTIDDNDDDPAGDELSPRIRLTSVPFAFRAFNLQPSAIVNVQGGQFAGDVTVGGAVGIGTSSPATNLDVRGNAVIQGNGGAVRQLEIRQFSSDAPYSRPNLGFSKARGTMTTPQAVTAGDHLWSIESQGFDGTQFDYAGGINMVVQGVTSGVVESSLNFDTANASSGTGVTAMTIDSNGRVGIGTTAPTTPLHVSRPGLDDDVAMTLQNGAVDWRVGVQGAIGDRFAITANGSADNPLVIDRGAGGGAQNDALRILANGAVSMKGNVGIGTSSPAQKLSVAGVIQSTSGGIMFPDGTVQGSALPPGCAAGQIPKWNGETWTCSADQGGIASINGLTGPTIAILAGGGMNVATGGGGITLSTSVNVCTWGNKTYTTGAICATGMNWYDDCPDGMTQGFHWQQQQCQPNGSWNSYYTFQCSITSGLLCGQ